MCRLVRLTLLILCFILQVLGIYDDADPNIKFHGAWIRNLDVNEQNWGSTITYTNVSGASATVLVMGMLLFL